MDFRSGIPFREIPLVAGDYRDVYLTFVDMNEPPPRSRYAFPEGTVFRMVSEDDLMPLSKEGTYDPVERHVRFSFAPGDYGSVISDRRVYYEVRAEYPDGRRYTVLRGDLLVSVPKVVS